MNDNGIRQLGLTQTLRVRPGREPIKDSVTTRDRLLLGLRLARLRALTLIPRLLTLKNAPSSAWRVAMSGRRRPAPTSDAKVWLRSADVHAMSALLASRLPRTHRRLRRSGSSPAAPHSVLRCGRSPSRRSFIGVLHLAASGCCSSAAAPRRPVRGLCSPYADAERCRCARSGLSGACASATSELAFKFYRHRCCGRRSVRRSGLP